MKKTIDKKYLIVGILLGIFLLLIIGACSLAVNEQTKNPDNWILQTYEDTVILTNMVRRMT